MKYNDVTFKMRTCLTAGPCAVGFMSLHLCVCTVNGTVVGGQSKWEAGENIPEHSLKRKWGTGGLKAKNGRKNDSCI